MPQDSTQLEQEFSLAVIQQRADALLAELASLRRLAGEESIHDTRVQSRRMRAALEAFRDLFAPHPWQALYDSVKEITRTLGKPREMGVLVGLLQELGAAGDVAESLCREYLVEKFRGKLSKQQKRLKKCLKDIDPQRFRSQMDFLLAAMEPHAGEVPAADPVASPAAVQRARRRRPNRRIPQLTLFPMQETARDRAGRVLQMLAQPLLLFRPRYDFRRASDEQLHALRISAKKVRYAMEIFSPVWPGGLDEQAARARALQDAGGLYHDWCVLCEYLKADIRRLDSRETLHLAFQIGRLLTGAEERRAELRKQILPALTALLACLKSLFQDGDRRQVPGGQAGQTEESPL